MAANTDAMLRAAINAVRANNKSEARALLEKVLEVEEYNEQAWIWLSAAVETDDEKRTCLENVLVINPNNANALAGLQALGGTNAPAASAFPSTPAFDLDAPQTPAFALDEDDLFADVDFGTPAPAKSAKPASNAWDMSIPTSSASALFDAPSMQDSGLGDDWVSGLGIKGGSGAPAAPASPAQNAFSAFDDDDFFNDIAATGSASSANAAAANAFDNDAFGADPFGAEPFGVNPFESSNAFSEDDFDSTIPASSRASAPSYRPPLATADTFENAISQPISENFDDLFADDAAPARSERRTMRAEDMTAEDLFGQIPADIKIGRLPGTDETVPTLTRLGLIVAVVLNIAAFTLLIARIAL